MAEATTVIRRYMRQRVRGVERLLRLGPPLRTLKSLPLGEPISPDHLRTLHRVWGNPAYEADIDYLELVCDYAVSAQGPVLECGSGLTTVLLALTAARRGVPVWSLEHDNGWYRAMRRVLTYFRLRGVMLCNAPLVQYDDLFWYRVPVEDMPPRFSLVVCDGPPASTEGGRRGLMAVMGERLRGATILLDDAERDAERAMLLDWANQSASVKLLRTNTTGSQVAVVSVGPDDAMTVQ